MKTYKKIDPLDIDEVLFKVEKSFNIKLDNESLMQADTYAKLYDLIINKISLGYSDTCTTQQAFYKLRCVIARVTAVEKCSITPHTKLSKLFPKDDRLKMVEQFDQEMGFETHLLQPNQWAITLFGLLSTGFLFMIFYNWMIGAVGFLASLAAFKLVGKFGKEIRLKTVGDFASKVSRESYLKVRRNPETINKNEIEQKVRELFLNDTQLDPVLLLRN
ncbi:MAG: hypothetical protein ACHQHN_02900 [Sphingobacteriales bacterium]